MDSAGDVSRLVPAVLSLAQDPDAAKAKAAAALKVVRERQQAMTERLKGELSNLPLAGD
jgi:hypothetical protein